jgi:hypothetical protein
MPQKFMLFFLLVLSTTIAKSQGMQTSDTASSKEIIFASDTQAPMWVETLWLKSHNNRAATKKIFSELTERDPSSVFLLGDVVNLGYSNKQWRPMDKYLQNLRDRGIKVSAVLGNHEVMGRLCRDRRLSGRCGA